MLGPRWSIRRHLWWRPRPRWLPSGRHLSLVGMAQPAEGRVSPTEVVATVLSQAQPDTATVVLEGAVQSVPPGN